MFGSSPMRDARPKTIVASVEYGGSYSTSTLERGACVRRADTADAMRQGADELRLLADWYERRPKYAYPAVTQ